MYIYIYIHIYVYVYIYMYMYIENICTSTIYIHILHTISTNIHIIVKKKGLEKVPGLSLRPKNLHLSLPESPGKRVVGPCGNGNSTKLREIQWNINGYTYTMYWILLDITGNIGPLVILPRYFKLMEGNHVDGSCNQVLFIVFEHIPGS